MENETSSLRFGAFSKAAMSGAIVGALAVQPAVTMGATGSVVVHAANGIWYLNTNITFNTTSSNWGLSEGTLLTAGGNLNDAFDGALSWLVKPAGGSTTVASGGGYVAPGGVVSLPAPAILSDPNIAKTITGNTQVIQGLNVTGQVYFSASKTVVRSILTLQNPTGSPISVRVWNANNLGSDASTYIQTTSSGDRTFDSTDNWAISSQGQPPASDPVLTYAWQGAGSAVRRTDSSAAFADGNDNPNEYYDVTVPAGATRRLMVFVQMSDNVANATTDAARFGSQSTLSGTDYLAGLTATELSEIVNWSLQASGPTSVPTLSEWSAALLSSVLAIFGIGRLRRQRNGVTSS